MQKTAKLLKSVTLLALIALAPVRAARAGAPTPRTVRLQPPSTAKNIMLAEVERALNQQAGGKQSQLSQLELAQARLQVLGSLIQREVLFQRAEREKMLPTEDQITALINQQKQQSGMTDDDFQKSLTEQNLTMETLRRRRARTLPSRTFRISTARKSRSTTKRLKTSTTAIGNSL